MSLLEEMMTECVMIDKLTVPDGYGGTMPSWQAGAPFNAAVVLNTSMEARMAEKQGVTALYTITTAKNVLLRYHDVLRRLSDGAIFRVTSDGDDKHTPASASLDMRQVTAERWSLPDA